MSSDSYFLRLELNAAEREIERLRAELKDHTLTAHVVLDWCHPWVRKHSPFLLAHWTSRWPWLEDKQEGCGE